MTASRRIATEIPAPADGLRLDDFLAGRFSYLEAAAWRGEIAAGRVLLNEGPAEAAAVLRRGDRVAYLPGDLPEPPVDGGYVVLFEDEAILAVNKPGNLPCHPAGRYFRHTLWAILRERLPGEGPFFVHRLDRETSGVVLLAKHARDASILGRQLASGAIRKRYAALVEGRFSAGTVPARGFVLADPTSRIRKKMRFVEAAAFPEAPPAGAKPCLTRFRALGTGPAVSLVSAFPETGRRHQIRATLLAMGHPVVGDKVYGVDESLFLRFIADRLTAPDQVHLRMDRQALHAASLSFSHPRTGRPLTIRAPLPQAFHRLVEAGD